MNVPSLIAEILRRLEQQFYAHLPRRDFKRDQDYLVAAIGTYGWECFQRGWEFDLDFIFQDLCRLLSSFKKSGTEITWMPIYLQNSIRQHIREHAEELQKSARANQTARLARKITDAAGLVRAIVEPSPIQLAASIYQDVKKLRRASMASDRATRADKQRQRALL